MGTTLIRAGTEVGYVEVPLDQVPPATWWAAERALLYCRRDLGLGLAWIGWIRPTHTAIARMEGLLERLARRSGDWNYRAGAFLDGPLTGQARGGAEDVVLVRADLTIEETVRTVAHECKHLDDLRRYRPPLTPGEHAAFEGSARKYEEQVAAALGA